MRAVLTYVLILFFFVSPTSAMNKAPLKQRIAKIIQDSGIPEKNMAIYIAEDLGDDAVYFQTNANQKLIPASISKLATAAAVIQKIPPGTKLMTRLQSTARVEDGVLKGDLYLVGGGDPGFVSESMWFLVNAFKRTGIQTIDGNILVDDSLFDDLRFDPTRQDIRVDRAYDAPVSAMSFNWNSVNVFVRPGKSSGEAASVFADPENDYIILKSSVKTVSKGGKSEIQVERQENKKNGQDIIHVSGKIALDSKEMVIYKNITQPDLWAGANLISFLKQRGIQVKGKVKTGRSPREAVTLAEQESKPVENMLSDMNKFSNNYIAEMLTKNLAATSGQQGTIAKGMEMVREFLISLGIKKSDFEMKNPSGLTRDNEMTAQAMWKVVHHMKDQFQYQPEFITSLPIAGIDGTLKKRMKETSAERWVRAKTGFLTNVVSLAGYIGRHDGVVVPFVMMFNGKSDEGAVRSLFDKICIAVVDAK
jgi:D-alanyl-D-alanine carboxypeptidase/D-alanyl-D-alanine-endopeptidase (penicillin-binding protein 4)